MKVERFKCNNCKAIVEFNRWSLLWLWLDGCVDIVCRNCGYKSHYRLISHIVRDNTVKFDENKDLDKKRMEVYRNG